ncbi:MAG: aldo/keto reductase [Clostridia bacterium]|nr:aldo/keto reductase [Clostridia bacterium]
MKGLELRTSDRLERDVTFVGFGGLEIGRNWGIGKDTARPDESEAGEVLNTVLDLGINLIDTASAYHRSEERIGKFISSRRNEYVLTSKCGEHNKEPGTYYDFSYNAVRRSIDNSLKLLNTDCIDVMQIHFGPGSKAVLDNGETLAAMQDARREGKIKKLGASIDGALATRCILSGDFDVIQLNYNLADRSNQKNIQLAAERGIAVLVRFGLGKGLFTPRVLDKKIWLNIPLAMKIKKLLKLVDGDMKAYMAIALQFLYREKGVTSVLLGSKKTEHIKSNLELLEVPIDEKVLQQAFAIFE